jgi:gas vesicle protein
MSSFASAAQGLNLKEGDALFGSAQQIWTMLDEMASSSPEKYAAFIAKQKKEHEELVRQNKPPTPKFAVSTKDVCVVCLVG